MGVDRRLDLLAADILAAADDDVLLPVDDEQIFVLVEIADVAGAKVEVGGEGGGGGGRVVPVSADVGGGADGDLAPLARRQMAVALAEDGELDDRLVRAAGRGGLVGVILPEIAAAGGVGLGEAVAQRRL